MIRFGPSGNSADFYAQGFKSTVEAPSWLSKLGLNAYEFSFGRGINVGKQAAEKIGEQCRLFGVEISVHAPYYINFANPSSDAAEKSYAYVLNSCRRLDDFGGKRVVFHPAALGKAERQDAVALTEKRLLVLRDKIYEDGLQDHLFCPEVMGKINQIGSLDEVLRFCALDKCFYPTIDFGHLNARTHGGLKTLADFEDVFKKSLDTIGREKTDNMHIHFSKIEYSQGGEVRHLTFDDDKYGPDFNLLAEAIVEFDLHPVIISESDKTQSGDAVTMKNIYEECLTRSKK